MKDLDTTAFFADSVLFPYKLLIINYLLVEAAGVGLNSSVDPK